MFRKSLHIAFGIALMLMVAAGTSQAQTWSAWATLTDGGSNLIQYRTAVVADTSFADGYRVDFEISNGYSDPVTFTATFNIPIFNPVDNVVDSYEEDYNYHLSGNTTAEGYIDGDAINSLAISALQIHVSDPDPEAEEYEHSQQENESEEEEVPE